MGEKIKKRRRGIARSSRKNQITLPVAALHAGDELRVEVDTQGRLVPSREDDVLEQFLAQCPVYQKQQI